MLILFQRFAENYIKKISKNSEARTMSPKLQTTWCYGSEFNAGQLVLHELHVCSVQIAYCRHCGFMYSSCLTLTE